MSSASSRPGRGRPRASSRELIEDAAFELFLENSYAKTTIDQIAQRAGVGRSTFFNYFDGKSDVFWGDVDSTFVQLENELATVAPDASLLDALADALARVAGGFGPSRVPWILTQHQLIGTVGEVQASALARFARWAGILSTFAAVRLDLDPSALLPRTIGYALTAAVVAAAQEWAQRGPERGDLAPVVAEAIAPIVRGFDAPPAAAAG